MSKSTRILKRLTALFLVVLMSINSMAAVVSDNDGTAFVTKAEFEALKENFGEQIDQYNTSIDGKIDGAIASYLAGVKLTAKETYSIIVSNWDDCVMLNGTLANDFAYPNVSGNLTIHEYRHNNTSVTDEEVVSPTTSTPATWVKLVWGWASFSYKNTKTTNGLNLVDNVVIGATVNTDNATWAGRATNATESWALSKVSTWKENTPAHDPAYLDAGYTNQFIISQYLNLTPNGYISSFTDTSNPIWVPTVRWTWSGGAAADGASDWGSGTCQAVSAIPSITYEKNSNGKIYEYEHIGNWKKDAAWEVSVKNAINYASKSSNNTKRTADWTSLVSTKTAKWTGTEISVKARISDKSNVVGFKTNNNSSFSNNTSAGGTNNYQIPTIGLLGSTLAAEKIYQWEKITDSDGVEVPRLKLHQGLVIMKVKQDEIVEWEPKFKDISVTGSTGINECKIILSYEPFTDKGDISDTKNYVKIDGVTKGEWVTTTDKKVKLKFEADRTGYVYAKWMPNADSSIIDGSTFWKATLDIANCNSYESIK